MHKLTAVAALIFLAALVLIISAPASQLIQAVLIISGGLALGLTVSRIMHRTEA